LPEQIGEESLPLSTDSDQLPGEGFDDFWDSLSVEKKLLAPSNLAFVVWKAARARLALAAAETAEPLTDEQIFDIATEVYGWAGYWQESNPVLRRKAIALVRACFAEQSRSASPACKGASTEEKSHSVDLASTSLGPSSGGASEPLGMKRADVVAALLDAQLALSYCGKAAVGRALNAQALRKIRAVLEEIDRQWKADLNTRAQGSQHVLKAEAARPDATDRETPALASPVGGPMGVGQPAAAGPLMAALRGAESLIDTLTLQCLDRCDVSQDPRLAAIRAALDDPGDESGAYHRNGGDLG
jgi:hypothetical protein